MSQALIRYRIKSYQVGNETHTFIEQMHMQIISDIHLEYRNGYYPFIPKKADNIALLGDIGKPFSKVYQRLIVDLSKRFKNVIVVAGNHEFFSPKRRKLTVGEIRAQMEDIASLYKNVHYLENKSIILDGVRFLGCTLWTSIPCDMWKHVRKKMNDYRMCYIQKYDDTNIGVPLSPEHTTFWHDQSVSWLKEQLDIPGYVDTPTVILTHHCPYKIGTGNPEFEGTPTQCCYATDLSSLFRKPLLTWAYGHTHYRSDQVVNGVRLISNPLGYPNELAHEQETLHQPIKIFLHGKTNK